MTSPCHILAYLGFSGGLFQVFSNINEVLSGEHVDPRRHCNVRMTSPCHILAYLRFSGRLFQVFFSNINEVFNGEQEQESIICVRI